MSATAPSARNMKNFVAIERGEGRLVVLCFLLAFFTGLPRLFSTAASSTLFLEVYSASLLPAIYILTAVINPLAGAAYLWIERRLNSVKSRAVVPIIFCVLQVAIWGSLRTIDAPWIRICAVLLAELEWILGLVVLWGIAADIFTVRQSKRLFAFIGVGEILALVTVGASIPWFVGVLGIPNLFLCAAVGQLLLLLSVISLAKAIRASEEGSAGGEESEEPARSAVAMLKDPYVQIPLLMIATTFGLYYFADAAFYRVAQIQFPDSDALADFIGRFFAVIGVSAILGRLFLAPWALARFGLTGTLWLTPVAVSVTVAFLGITLIADAPMVVLFWAVVAVKFSERFLWDAVGRQAYTTLYQPLPAAERSASMTVAETQVAQVAGGVAGVLLLLLLKVANLGLNAIVGGMAVLLAASMWLAYLGSKRYPEKLSNTLARRGLNWGELDLANPATADLVEAKLQGPDPDTTVYCMRILADAEHPGLPEHLMKMTSHVDWQVSQEAYRQLQKIGTTELFQPLLEQLHGMNHPESISAALGAIATSGGVDAMDALRNYLDHESELVRRTAMTGMIRDCGVTGAVFAGGRLMEMVESPDPTERRLVAEVIGDVGVTNFYTVLLPLLGDVSLDVRAAAIVASGKLQAPRTWPAVIEGLKDDVLRGPASNALVQGKGDALAAMKEVPADSQRGIEKHLLAVAGRMRLAEATHYQFERLENTAGRPDPTVLQTLGRHKVRSEEAPLVRRLLKTEYAVAVQALRAIVEVEDLSFSGLNRALKLENFRSLERIFQLLALEHPSDQVHCVWETWQQGAAKHRALAVELLGSLLERDTMDMILPLLEDLPAEICLQRLPDDIAPTGLDSSTRLLDLATSASWSGDWTQALALDALAQRGEENTDALFEEALASNSPILRNVVEYWMERKDGPELRAQRERVAGAVVARHEFSLIDRVEFLRATEIFGDVPEDMLAEIALELNPVILEEGESLFQSGDEGSALYIIAIGSVRIHDQKDRFTHLGPGEILGELAALDPQPRSASATALSPTILFALEQERLYRLLGESADVGLRIIRVLCRRLRGPAMNETSIHTGEPCPTPRKQDTLSNVERVIALKTADIFSETPSQILAGIATMADEATLAAGSPLFFSGEYGSTMYIIVSGRLKVHLGDRTIAELGRRESVGEMALLASTTRSFSVTAIEDTLLLSLSQSALQEVLYAQPEVMRMLIQTLVRRLRKTGIQGGT